MTGRVIIVTGGTSGIGLEVAKYLCEGGNDVTITCRDQEKGWDALRRVKDVHPNSLINWMQLDLSSTTSVRDFVKDFMHKKRKLNVLINNAGMALNFKDMTRKTTKEGNEITMATNHLGHFLLTNLLLDFMTQTASVMGDGRIINVSCAGHDHEHGWGARDLEPLDTKNFQLQNESSFNGHQAYTNSKLCNVLMTYTLAEHLKGTDVVCNSIDPGNVPTTELSRHAGKMKRTFNICCVHKVMRPLTHSTRTTKEAAAQICNLATSEKYEGRNGKYFIDGVEDRSSIESYDKDLQRKVWKLSADLMEINRFADEDFDDVSLG